MKSALGRQWDSCRGRKGDKDVVVKGKASANGGDERGGAQGTKSTKNENAPEAGDWRAALDEKSGRTYYYHAETREVRWNRPEKPTSSPEWDSGRGCRGDKEAVVKDESGANKGNDLANISSKASKWRGALDKKSRRTYYFHTETREVRWRTPDFDFRYPMKRVY